MCIRDRETTGGRDKASILADTMEALIGTIYLSGGLRAAAEFVHHLFDPLLATAAGLGAGLDWKTSLQELCSAGSLGAPDYRLVESGPDHEKSFVAAVLVAHEVLGEWAGGSKKEAEQAEVCIKDRKSCLASILARPSCSTRGSFVASRGRCRSTPGR